MTDTMQGNRQEVFIKGRYYSPSARNSGASIADVGAIPLSSRKPRMAALVPLPASPSMEPE